jgi:plastocyanin domain-containing protein
MNATNTLVVLAGLAAIAWVNWYFFLAQRRAVTAAQSGGLQQVEILVKGGYEPGVIKLKRGQPARLVFDRQETSSCSEEVVLPAFGIRRALPAFKKTAIDFTPKDAGTFDVSCGMSMLHAKLVVEG